ncbi:MAG TPA: two-component regulator propeller domain-containing protein, partial [Tahibacter sp.]|nr:two-component regulator propeller domain-containing protein [Tahibacter sp.]
MVRWLLCPVLYFVCALASPHAEPPVLSGHPLFRTYGPLQGLPDLGVMRLAQDRAGFVWVATENGLYRYDGHRFEVFGLRDGLQSISITSLYEDAAGTLWVGTRAGLHRRAGDRFVAVRIDGGGTFDVVDVSGDANGLYVATTVGAYRLAAGDALRPMPGWPGGGATAVFRDPRTARTWFARWTDRAEIHVEHADRWSIATIPALADGGRIGGIVGDAQGRVWMRQGSPTTVGLAVADADGTRFAPVALPPDLRARVATGFGYMLAGRRGDVWVPVDNGLLHHDGGHWRFLDIAKSLRTAWTRAVLEDREGSLWIGSNGLHRMLRNGVFTAYTAAEGYVGDVAWALRRDRERRLWIAGTGLTQFRATDLRTVPGTDGHYLRSIAED